MQPATIKIFLTDGNPEGIRTAEISNWTGKAIAGPRSELQELLARPELAAPGVYFLFGVDPYSDRPSLYIGEAESVRERLKQHNKRDDWSQVIAVVSKDENLTKAHIRYLEGALIQLATDARRAQLKNSTGSGARLPESDQADMDIFLTKILQLLPVLGMELFKDIRRDQPQDKPQEHFYCTIKGLKATGRRSSGGFIVFKDSQAVKEHRPSADYSRRQRMRLIEDGTLLDRGDHYIFAEDFEFSSPSAAGTVIRGGATNGLTAWKNADGISLKELEEQREPEPA